MPTNQKSQRFSDELRLQIANALHEIRSYDLPDKCSQLGLGPGTSEEAFSSKRGYVKVRIKDFSETALLELARAVLLEVDAPSLHDLLSEHELPVGHRISQLTRREVLKVLNQLDELFGDLGRSAIYEHLDVLSPPMNRISIHGGMKSLADDVDRHYLRNYDWSHFQLLEECGALLCTQERFVRFLENLLHPLVRKGEEQSKLAGALNDVLKADGYAVRTASYESGHPVYHVVRRNLGAGGSPKNIIFASIGAKPELVLIDAVTNDIKITKHANLCLVYDRPLSRTAGLGWIELAQWWQDVNQEVDIKTARESLGNRLLRSVELSSSPGEYAIFTSYFKEFSPRLGDRLPALIPQVYLHYDPLTIAQRGTDQILPRQRMDFLMLLEGNVRVVIEVDGKQHYEIDGKASPQRYAEMVVEDRRLRLQGYELYRFGGYEFSDSTNREAERYVGAQSQKVVRQFFEDLFVRHSVLPDPKR